MLERTDRWMMSLAGLGRLLEVLRQDGRTVVGPTVREGVIALDTVGGIDDLPRGRTDTQGPGAYHLEDSAGTALFAHNLGADSWKRVLFPPRVRLWRLRRTSEGFVADDAPDAAPRLALIGVRACELSAIAVNDRVWRDGDVADPFYATRRSGVIVIAVQCTTAGGTCFCPSMGTGPRVTRGYDIALTEIAHDGPHRFVVEVGSEAGADLLGRLPVEPVGEADRSAPEAAAVEAEASIRTHLDTTGLRERLMAALESPRWARLAERCLGCASCTMVCPTCFCTSVEDHTSLSGDVERQRRMASCFTLEHSVLHGGAARSGLAARYRQWMVHKLSTWHDQFDTSGCVGCGRCITWCPAGIDFTEEARLAAAPSKRG